MVLRFVPGAFTLLFGIGVQLSGVEIPWLGYSLMGFAFLLLGIPAWFSRDQLQASITFQSPIVRNSPPTRRDEREFPEHHYAGVVRTMRDNDRQKPMDMLRISPVEIDWTQAALKYGAYLDFNFRVYSAAIHTLHFDGGCDGNLFYIADHERGAIAAALTAWPVDTRGTKITNLPRGHEAEIRLHQFLTPEVQKSLMGHVGKVVTFDFSEIHIPMPTKMISEGGTNDVGPIWQVDLPISWEVAVPDILNLINSRR